VQYDNTAKKLSPKRFFEYRWNTCVNVNGGICNNIADDNLVELHVKILKDLLRHQGANVTNKSARVASVIIKYIDGIKNSFAKFCGVSMDASSRISADKQCDVEKIGIEVLHSFSSETVVNYKDPVLK
jgi:hypothetical protein